MYISPDGDYELEPMVTKHATRLPNTRKLALAEAQSVNISVPKNLVSFMDDTFGEELLEKLKERKGLTECAWDEEDECVRLSGNKEQLEAATKFLKFNLDNLLYVDKLREMLDELKQKLGKLESQVKAAFKKEFYVPGEIVGLLVGQG